MSKYGSPEWEEAERQMKADIYRRGRAEGLREAAGMLVDETGDYVCPFEARRILARAQELAPKYPLGSPI